MAFVVCGTYGYAIDGARGSSIASKAQLLGAEAVAGGERRLTVRAPSNKHASGGTAGDADGVGLAERVAPLSRVVRSVGTHAVAVFKRRLLSNAQPRAPPRRSER